MLDLTLLIFLVMDACVIEEIGCSSLSKEPSLLSQWGQVKVPGIHPSMSMSDLVIHLGNCIAEQKGFNGNEQLSRDILEELTRYLLNDSNILASSSDELSLMSRVNSLCCLLQDSAAKSDTNVSNTGEVSTRVQKTKIEVGPPEPPAELNSGSARAMSRKDSVGDLLLHLPRIASLPHILPVVPEDSASGRR